MTDGQRAGAAVVAGAVALVLLGLPQLGWGSVASALLMSGVLVLGLRWSSARGPELVVALATLHFGVTALSTLPEGVLFDVVAPSSATSVALRALVSSLLMAVVLVGVAGRLSAGSAGSAGSATPGVAREASTPRSPAGRSLRGLLWRVVATPAVFVLCYFVAGMIVYPFVEPYYAVRTMPDPGAIASMQVLRALTLAAVSYPLLRTLSKRRDAVLVLATALPVLGAIAPMLPANVLMPPFVRLVHSLEMTPYYALFGALLAVWYGPPRQGAAGERRADPPVSLDHAPEMAVAVGPELPTR